MRAKLGVPGPAGPAGPAGSPGPAGLQGPAGVKGADGTGGAAGADGARGPSDAWISTQVTNAFVNGGPAYSDVATLELPAGSFALTATTSLTGTFANTPRTVECRLGTRSGGGAVTVLADAPSGRAGGDVQATLTVLATATLAAARTAVLQCQSADNNYADAPRIVATQVATLHP